MTQYEWMEANKNFGVLICCLSINSWKIGRRPYSSGYRLCQSPSDSYWHSSSGPDTFGSIYVCGTSSWLCWILCDWTYGRFDCSSVAIVNWFGPSRQLVFVVPECGLGRKCFGGHTACWYCWCGTYKSPGHSKTDREVSWSIPYWKPSLTIYRIQRGQLVRLKVFRRVIGLGSP